MSVNLALLVPPFNHVYNEGFMRLKLRRDYSNPREKFTALIFLSIVNLPEYYEERKRELSDRES